MRLTAYIAGRSVGLMLLAGVLMVACSVYQPLASQNSVEASPAPVETGSQSVTPSESTAARTENIAQASCSAILDDIPLVVVKSGKATLAAAYEVTGKQLASYHQATFAQDGTWSLTSPWRDQPTRVVDMCLFDGDFMMMTPGPPGHDTTAARVLVVISDGVAELWAMTKDKSALPTNDPATMSQ